ncbi:MAG: hypothetical protein FWG14_04520 [Peptococcaceae bacterium]|nr:hypothetical protein [Peptococcaceae bacterium]
MRLSAESAPVDWGFHPWVVAGQAWVVAGQAWVVAGHTWVVAGHTIGVWRGMEAVQKQVLTFWARLRLEVRSEGMPDIMTFLPGMV